MLLPLSLWGQHNGVLGEKLRNEVLKASEEIPAVSVVFNFAERYLGMLQGMDNAERLSRMERDDVRIPRGSVENLALINDKTSLAFAEKNDRYNLLIFNSETPLIIPAKTTARWRTATSPRRTIRYSTTRTPRTSRPRIFRWKLPTRWCATILPWSIGSHSPKHNPHTMPTISFRKSS